MHTVNASIDFTVTLNLEYYYMNWGGGDASIFKDHTSLI